MFTEKERKSIVDSLATFIESDFTCMDVVLFVKENYLVQYALRNCDYYDYSDELDFIENHSDCDIECILNSSHDEFYDSEYGNSDPLPSFRFCSSDYKGKLTIDNIGNCDNILSHILFMVEDDLDDMGTSII